MQPLIALPVTAYMVYRAHSRRSLTPWGIFAAVLTAAAHAVHPWSVFFTLLIVFFMGGTTVTKVNHVVKETLTLSSSADSGGEGPRTAVQVFANSGVASLLILLHAWKLYHGESGRTDCWSYGTDPLVVGIIANYAAVAADTFSSELGILSKSEPRLIISVTLQKVPKGTNGGVTILGLGAGLLGASTIAISAVSLLPFCGTGALASRFTFLGGWTWQHKASVVAIITLWGGLGSVLDSVLGALLQASVVDTRSGKIVEGHGGEKVLFHSGEHDRAETSGHISGASPTRKKSLPRRQSPPNSPTEFAISRPDSRKISTGHDILDNNQVNFAMAATMSVSAILLYTWIFEIPLRSSLS